MKRKNSKDESERREKEGIDWGTSKGSHNVDTRQTSDGSTIQVEWSGRSLSLNFVRMKSFGSPPPRSLIIHSDPTSAPISPAQQTTALRLDQPKISPASPPTVVAVSLSPSKRRVPAKPKTDVTKEKKRSGGRSGDPWPRLWRNEAWHAGNPLSERKTDTPNTNGVVTSFPSNYRVLPTAYWVRQLCKSPRRSVSGAAACSPFRPGLLMTGKTNGGCRLMEEKAAQKSA